MNNIFRISDIMYRPEPTKLCSSYQIYPSFYPSVYLALCLSSRIFICLYVCLHINYPFGKSYDPTG